MAIEHTRGLHTESKSNSDEKSLKGHLRQGAATSDTEGLLTTRAVTKPNSEGKQKNSVFFLKNWLKTRADRINETNELKACVKGHVNETASYVCGLLNYDVGTLGEPKVKLLRGWIPLKAHKALTGAYLFGYYSHGKINVSPNGNIEHDASHETIHWLQDEIGYTDAVNAWHYKERNESKVVLHFLRKVLFESSAILLSAAFTSRSSYGKETSDNKKQILMGTAYGQINAKNKRMISYYNSKYAEALYELKMRAKRGELESLFGIGLSVNRGLNWLITPSREDMMKAIHFISVASAILSFAASGYDVVETARVLLSKKPGELFDLIGTTKDKKIDTLLRAIDSSQIKDIPHYTTAKKST